MIHFVLRHYRGGSLLTIHRTAASAAAMTRLALLLPRTVLVISGPADTVPCRP